VSNQNWNDPAGTPPNPPQPPYGQPSVPDPQAPAAYTAPDAQGTSPYTAPTYDAPTYTTPSYGTPDSQAASPASGTPGYSAPDTTTPSYGAAPSYGTDPASTPSYGTPATGGYTAPDTTTPSYGAAPSYGTDPASTPSYGTPATGGYTAPDTTTPSYGSTTPSYGTDPAAGSYGTPSAPAAGYTDPSQPAYGTDPNQGSYGAPTGGYGQSQPGQYGAAGYGQAAEGYQDPNAAYGAAPAGQYGAGYPAANVSPYGYDSGYASATPELATFGSRAIGWLIDYFAPGLVIVVVSSILDGILLSGNSSAGVGIAFLLDIILRVALLAFFVWNSGYTAGITGYSLGRKIAKNKLVSETTGQVIGAGAGVGRVFAHFVDGLICGIGWLFPLWDSKRQTIADKIVKTVVVADPNAGQAQAR
jgi:uncharacterized RDD family membrane protein YckC